MVHNALNASALHPEIDNASSTSTALAATANSSKSQSPINHPVTQRLNTTVRVPGRLTTQYTLWTSKKRGNRHRSRPCRAFPPSITGKRSVCAPWVPVDIPYLLSEFDADQPSDRGRDHAPLATVPLPKLGKSPQARCVQTERNACTGPIVAVPLSYLCFSPCNSVPARCTRICRYLYAIRFYLIVENICLISPTVACCSDMVQYRRAFSSLS